MRNQTHRLHAVAILTIALGMTSCTTGTEPNDNTTAPTAGPFSSATNPAPGSPTPGSGTTDAATTDLEDAVLRIEAQGSFSQPTGVETFNQAGVGSGFFISPDGLAITNNHVVTGAATLEVKLEGQDEPHNATVVGVSECADLAVIDVDGGNYPFLALNEEPIIAGADVLAAGFPEGTETLTVTSGAIADDNGHDDTSWASVDGVLAHDATIRHGNSGGPLVNLDGTVVAVNYAGDDTSGQGYAIATAQAFPTIRELMNGHDVDTVGVNGQALLDPVTGASGVFVASVASGSPADQLGIRGGDIIARLEGLILATDGTMADYCSVLRSHTPDDQLAVEIYRPDSDEYLTGRLNDPNDTLDPVLEWIDEAEDDTNTLRPEPLPRGNPYPTYDFVTDDLGMIGIDVPTSWADRATAPIDLAMDTPIPSIRVSPDLTTVTDTDNDVTSPFVQFIGIPGRRDGTPYQPEELLDIFAPADECRNVATTPFDDPLFTGTVQVQSKCAGSTTTSILLAATELDTGNSILLSFDAASEADFAALDRVMLSLTFLPAFERVAPYEIAPAQRKNGTVTLTDHPPEGAGRAWPTGFPAPSPATTTDSNVGDDRTFINFRIAGATPQEVVQAYADALTSDGYTTEPIKTEGARVHVTANDDTANYTIEALAVRPAGQVLVQVATVPR